MPRNRLKKINPPKRLEADRSPEIMRRFLRLCSCNQYTGCWLWLGHRDENGYGQFKLNGQAVGAHRASFALFRRPVRDGRQIDHKLKKCCTSCVNPWHLRELSPLANAADGGRRRHEQKGDGIPF